MPRCVPPDARPDAPMTREEVACLLRPWQGAELALAVSGGSDSTALMILVAEWWGELPVNEVGSPCRPPAVVTVDHGLRPASSGEAEAVAVLCRKLGLAHTTLRWLDDKPRSGLQAAARAARYRLIERWLATEAEASGRPARALLAAHTADDQRETFAMRLDRGSGSAGLAGMRHRSFLWTEDAEGAATGHGLEIGRPFLAVPRARLRASLEKRSLGWLDDPSNDDPGFERIRVRRTLALEERGNRTADSSGLLRTVERLQRVRATIDDMADRVETAFVDDHAGAWASLPLDGLLSKPDEIAIEILRRLMVKHSGRPLQHRLAEAERVHSRLVGLPGDADCPTFTTAGVGFDVVRTQAPGVTPVRVLRATREAGRRALPCLTLRPGEAKAWDQRFWIELAAGTPVPAAGQAITVRPLDDATRSMLRDAGVLAAFTAAPRRHLATLPVIWLGSEPIAVPHLGWRCESPDIAGTNTVLAGLRIDWPLLSMARASA